MFDLKPNDYKSRIKSDFQKELKKLNPFIMNSFIGAILSAFAGVYYAINKMLVNVIKQLFANTASYEHLKLQAQNRINILPPTKANGMLFSSVDDTCRISRGEEFTDIGSNLTYTVDNDVESNIYNIKGVILTCSNGVCEVDFRNPHNLTDCMILIEDIPYAELNTYHDIRVTSPYRFEFNITTNIDINMLINEYDFKITTRGIYIPITAKYTGKKYNKEPLLELKSNAVIPNLNTTKVLYNGLQGGRDEETEEEYRQRFLSYLRKPQSYFNEHDVRAKILENFPKVTRVYIESNFPTVHSITFNCINDNVANLKLDDDYLADIKKFIFDYAPVGIIKDALIVENCKVKEFSINFDYIKPSTESLKRAVREDIKDYIASLNLGESIRIDMLMSVIYATIDFNDHTTVESFSIDINDDIIIPPHHIGRLV